MRYILDYLKLRQDYHYDCYRGDQDWSRQCVLPPPARTDQEKVQGSMTCQQEVRRLVSITTGKPSLG